MQVRNIVNFIFSVIASLIEAKQSLFERLLRPCFARPRNDTKLKRSLLYFYAVILLISGCQASSAGNIGQLQSYAAPTVEADWVRNGEPIEYEGEKWLPMDGTESLLDSEVQLMGEYRGVQFFTDKEDVRPFHRLYTKFGRNKYRYFEKILHSIGNYKFPSY